MTSPKPADRDETWQGRERVATPEGEDALTQALVQHGIVTYHQEKEAEAVKRRRALMVEANDNGVTIDGIADRLKLSISVVRKQMRLAREEALAPKPARGKGKRRAA